jgi:hypothetical protein
MTAVAEYLLQARGAYRSPSNYGFSFLVITDIHRPIRQYGKTDPGL